MAAATTTTTATGTAAKTPNGRAILLFPLLSVESKGIPEKEPQPKSGDLLVVVTYRLWTVIASVALTVDTTRSFLRVRDSLNDGRTLLATENCLNILEVAHAMESHGKEGVSSQMRSRSVQRASPRYEILERFSGDLLIGIQFGTPFRWSQKYLDVPSAYTLLKEPMPFTNSIPTATGWGPCHCCKLAATSCLSTWLVAQTGTSLATPSIHGSSYFACQSAGMPMSRISPSSTVLMSDDRLQTVLPFDDFCGLSGCRISTAETKIVQYLRTTGGLLHYTSHEVWPMWRHGVMQLAAAASLRNFNPALMRLGTSRLMRDIADCMRDPVEGVQLSVNEHNVRALCAVLTPSDDLYKGIRLHLSIIIPHAYPRECPEITIDTPIPHPNIFGGNKICCDVLQGHLFRYTKTNEIGGYTPAYRLQTLLVQLLSMFSATHLDQICEEKQLDSRTSFKLSLRASVSSFSCPDCGFGPPLPLSSESEISISNNTARASNTRSKYECSSNLAGSGPRIPAWYHVRRAVTIGQGASELPAASPGRKRSVLDLLVEDVWQNILSHLTTKEISRLTSAYPRLPRVLNVDLFSIRQNLSCFYYRTNYTESILGVGVLATSADDSVSYSSTFDVLSLDAFKKGRIRRTPWGERFSHFMPLAINIDHFRRSRRHIERAIMALNSRPDDTFDLSLIIPTLAKWMNQTIVSLMATATTQEVHRRRSRFAQPILHASENAVTGYHALLHLLLAMVQAYPEVLPSYHAKAFDFLEDRDARHKKLIPDLGEFLVWLALVPGFASSSAWCNAFIEELFARNTVWVLERFRHLGFEEGSGFVSERRLKDSFEGSKTWLRLALFQVRFLEDLTLTGSFAAGCRQQRLGKTASEAAGKVGSMQQNPVLRHQLSGPSPNLTRMGAAGGGRSAETHTSTTAPDSKRSSGSGAEDNNVGGGGDGVWFVVNRRRDRWASFDRRTSRPADDVGASASGIAERQRVTKKQGKHFDIPLFDAARARAHVDTLFRSLGATLGFPTADAATRMASYARAVFQVDSYSTFFRLIGGRGLVAEEGGEKLATCKALRAALRQSYAAGYHRMPYSPGELWSLRFEVEPTAAGPSPPEGWDRPQFKVPIRSFFLPGAGPRPVRKSETSALQTGSRRRRQPRMTYISQYELDPDDSYYSYYYY
ncbi:hypothetical protein DFJ73DRAFT_806731 [Zopfochytrium polystomum]|nr:hypothetical protein DFJ73DRAFT_806731 [Zopfochytrium polystomum]